uniref:Uncharacterized protein n=1 Tax=Rhizophora mucronata TaxID=61149 RepID=A0A2P2PWF4_RHIMU
MVQNECTIGNVMHLQCKSTLRGKIFINNMKQKTTIGWGGGGCVHP